MKILNKILNKDNKIQKVEFYSKLDKKEKTMMIAKRDIDAYTRNIPISDVKTYLLKEYERAFEREDYIKTLEKQIEDYKVIEQKYSAMLVVQEQREERYKKQEEQIIELKMNVNKKEEEINKEKEKQLNTIVNAEEEKKILEYKIAELSKEKEIIGKEAIEQFKVNIINKINSLKGHISKATVLKLFE